MTTSHDACCCAETLTNYRALQSAYGAASRDRDELVGLLLETTAERDRARDTAARLEAELARGFRTAAPDITLSRDSDGPATPNNPDPVHGIVQIRPGSENSSAYAYPPRIGPESPQRVRVTIETRLGAWTITLNRAPEPSSEVHPQGDVFADTARADPLPDPQPGDMDARRPTGF